MGEPQVIALEGVAPGMELGEVVFGPISRDDIKAYSLASGDDNPIHLDEDFARSTGAPTVFAMGMLPAAYLAHAVSDWFGSPEHIRRYRVRFVTRVWPGDELVCVGRVESMEDRVLHVRIEARRRGRGPEGLDLAPEETALLGEADIELPE